MKKFILPLLAVLVASPSVAQDADAASKIAERDLRYLKQIVTGTYTNEEQVYFQGDLNMPEADHVPRVELTIERDGDGFKTVTRRSSGEVIEARHDYRVQDGEIRATVLRFGRADCERSFTREFDSFRGKGCGDEIVISPKGIRISGAEKPINMLRARSFKCWVSPRKNNGEYAFYNDQFLHDQGGRFWIEASEDHPRVGLKMRNVNWPTGVNRNSLVLYAYRGDDEDSAVSYTWTSPEGTRLGLNLRWLQVSCTAGDADISTDLNLKTGSGN